MKKSIIILAIFFAGNYLTSCSNAPKRKVAGPGTPPPSQVAADGRIQPRGNGENRKRMEHYNSLQHK